MKISCDRLVRIHSQRAVFFGTAIVSASLMITGLTGCGGGGSSADPETPDESEGTATDVEQTDIEIVEPDPPANPRADLGIALPPGFQAEVLYDVPGDTQGSWVSLTAGPDGTLFASDQYGEVYHVAPPSVDDYLTETEIKSLGLGIGGAQGLCWFKDALYIMVNGKGLFRAADTDGDGAPDSPEMIVAIEGGGEHGQHAIIPSADGESLLVCCGNHTRLPALTSSRVPQAWGEDHLLKREWDANGHAAGVLAPGGFILEVSPDASEVELISMGYRNEYDIALNRNGELFTFDADMEWDMGAPWYRPTRVCHAVSGSEFGWRSGTGKWPTYYPDSLPPVVDIGPGSPTGVLFGTGAAFPATYQDALFILDWTFGTMYAVHLTPDGATYSAQVDEFLSSKPLPLTDAVIGDDGAMYFATGGRRVQSRLYRVHYYGVRDTSPAPALPAPTAEAKLRHELEQFHRADAPAEAIDTVWPALGHRDRFVRFAARVALEHQPVERWRERALAETSPAASIEALLALARLGNADDLAPLLASTARLEDQSLSTQQRLSLLRVYQVAFVRLGAPNESQRDALAAALDPQLPSNDDDVNAELARVLIYLESPSVIDKCLALMNAPGQPKAPDWTQLLERNDQYGGSISQMLHNPPPTRKLNFAFMLRNLTTGWTESQRRAYFLWLNRAMRATGGNSYRGFVNQIQQQALDACGPTDRAAMDAYIATLPNPDANQPAPGSPLGPGRAWTTAEAINAVEGKLTGRDFDRGAELYQSTLCAQCHRFAGEGGNIGPDLSTVSGTYSLRDLVTHIVEPSRDITDQYAQSVVTLRDGSIRTGRIVLQNSDMVRIATSNTDLSQTVDFPRSDIASIALSPVSPMPTGLVDPMNPDELRNLIAYLMSAGDREHAMFAE
ncbi:MAG: c-type cytochrome [Phycisphaerales bacterium JB063]